MVIKIEIRNIKGRKALLTWLDCVKTLLDESGDGKTTVILTTEDC